MIEESHTDRQSTILVRTERPGSRPQVDRRADQLRRPSPCLHGPGIKRATGPSSFCEGFADDLARGRQFRVQGAVVLALLVVVAIVAALTGPHMSQVHNAFLVACKRANDCDSATDPVTNTYHSLLRRRCWLLLLPVLLGLFWGRTPRRAGARDRHVSARLDPERNSTPLAAGQARRRRLGLDVRGGAFEPDGDVVVEAPRCGAAESFWRRHVRASRRDTDWLRGLRIRAWCRQAGVFIRRVLPAMVMTLVAYIARASPSPSGCDPIS